MFSRTKTCKGNNACDKKVIQAWTTRKLIHIVHTRKRMLQYFLHWRRYDIGIDVLTLSSFTIRLTLPGSRTHTVFAICFSLPGSRTCTVKTQADHPRTIRPKSNQFTACPFAKSIDPSVRFTDSINANSLHHCPSIRRCCPPDFPTTEFIGVDFIGLPSVHSPAISTSYGVTPPAHSQRSWKCLLDHETFRSMADFWPLKLKCEHFCQTNVNTLSNKSHRQHKRENLLDCQIPHSASYKATIREYTQEHWSVTEAKSTDQWEGQQH